MPYNITTYNRSLGAVGNGKRNPQHTTTYYQAQQATAIDG